MVKFRPLVLKKLTGESLFDFDRPEHLSGNPIFDPFLDPQNDPKTTPKIDLPYSLIIGYRPPQMSQNQPKKGLKSDQNPFTKQRIGDTSGGQRHPKKGQNDQK